MFSKKGAQDKLKPESRNRDCFLITRGLKLLGQGSLCSQDVTRRFTQSSLRGLVFSLYHFRRMANGVPREISMIKFPFGTHQFVRLRQGTTGVSSSYFACISISLPNFPRSSVVSSTCGSFTGSLFKYKPGLDLGQRSEGPCGRRRKCLSAYPRLHRVAGYSWRHP